MTQSAKEASVQVKTVSEWGQRYCPKASPSDRLSLGKTHAPNAVLYIKDPTKSLFIQKLAGFHQPAF